MREMRITDRWLAGEKKRADVIIERLKATIEAINLDRELEEWTSLRENAASLVHTASQLQAQASVLTIIEPTENATKARETGDKP